ncbi:MAG: D-aminoacylase [Symbiobacteriaceae bacterium]|nr:D-aminoacylase [Symbiobacteriaceae bacterium]
MYDLIIKNAKVVDGTGAPWYIADVAVLNGKIAAIGRLHDASATRAVDAQQNVLAPGFIDIHSHSDFGILQHNLNESRILQGVTTELAGDCGLSPMPVNPDKVDLLQKYVGFLGSGGGFDWTDTTGFLDTVANNGSSVNFAVMLGHGTVRLAVMGFDDRAPTADELQEMRRLTALNMEQGCFGLSTGLIYPPGCFAKNDEIIDLARVVAAYGGFYESHMRWEGDEVLQSVEDTIEVARQAGLPAQIVHHKISGRKNWKYKAHATTARIAKAREEGLDITADQYPYCASATTLTSTLPTWTFEGGTEKMLSRLQDPEIRQKIVAEMRATFSADLKQWSDVFVASVPGEQNAWVKGLNIEAIAERQGKDPFEAAIDLLIEENGDVSQVSFGMCEEDVELIMQQPFVMIGSDGSTIPLDTTDVPHPRNFGTFPRVIAKYCRDRKLFSLETAIHKMTAMPAARMGLGDRGVIKVGMWADLVLFDFAMINDTPSFAKPAAACEGIRQVYVNGVLTAENGRHTGALAGQVLRRGED